MRPGSFLNVFWIAVKIEFSCVLCFAVHVCRLFEDSENQDALPLCPEERRFCIFSLGFSSDGREILGGANDGFLYVYDRECNQRALRVSDHHMEFNNMLSYNSFA